MKFKPSVFASLAAVVLSATLVAGGAAPAQAASNTKCTSTYSSKTCVKTTSTKGTTFDEKYRTSMYNGTKKTATYVCNKSVTKSSSWTFSASASTEIKAGLSFLAQGSVKVEVGGSYQKTMTSSFSHGATVKVPPGYTGVCKYGFLKRKASGTWNHGWYSAGKGGSKSGKWSASFPTEDHIDVSIRKGR